MAQYDEIDCLLYDQQRQSETFLPERQTIRSLVGNVADINVLDLACGSGIYTRMIKQAGAARVIGVDISSKMLAVARQKESSRTIGVEYIQANVTKMPSLGKFHLITAIWLFNYATTRAELNSMFSKAAKNLGRNGRIVALTLHPDFTLSDTGWEGWNTRNLTEAKLGNCSRYTHTYSSAELSFYQWSREAYEDALKRSGFASISWHEIEISKNLLTGPNATQWANFAKNPPLICLSATAT
ncbi:class I SAM-dependent methyltransferase [Streptomyces sp. NPDC099088]|uniref:class I SAM-dependent methyltransferase n=1 Tax=Streptomyces sp. NPDC099088 TaxID=3366101 RepID=UPI0037F47BA7